jgi:membrane dipeptidase
VPVLARYARCTVRMTLVYWIPLIALIGLAACRSPGPAGDGAKGAATDRPVELARTMLIVDTHIDVPYKLVMRMRDVGAAAEGMDFDYPRAREGGLDVAFMSIYVPAKLQEEGGARDLADELIDLVEGIATAHPDKFTVVASPDDARETADAGRIGLALGMENGAPVEGDLANLRHFHDRGIRYITLTHSENNEICDSSYADEKTWNGLSPFGETVVAEMNRLGIMVDISHVSDDAFYQIADVTRAPLIASHSSCRHFTPDWERNMDDDMIRRLAEGGGVIQINFGSAFLLEEAQKQSSAFWKAAREHFEEHDLDESDEEARDAFRESYWKNRTRIYADVSDVADHIDHVVRLAGIDHVGLGSDFEGVGDSLPTGLKDVAGYPNLIRELLERGYSDEEIEKICGGNLMRVWREVERVAAEMQSAAGA